MKIPFIIKAFFVVLISAVAVVGVSYLSYPYSTREMVLIEGEEYLYDIDSIFPSASKPTPRDPQNQRE